MFESKNKKIIFCFILITKGLGIAFDHLLKKTISLRLKTKNVIYFLNLKYSVKIESLCVVLI